MFVMVISDDSMAVGEILAQRHLCDLWLWFPNTSVASAFALDPQNATAAVIVFDQTPRHDVHVMLERLRIDRQMRNIEPIKAILLVDQPGERPPNEFSRLNILALRDSFRVEAPFLFSLLGFGAW